MVSRGPSATFWTSPFWFCVVARVLLFVSAAGQYGYIPDELYFLDAGRKLSLGYVDFPPLIAWASRLVQALADPSLVAIRVPPLLAGIAASCVSVQLCREVGGSRLAQWVTAFVVTLSPLFLLIHSFLTMNSFDQLWWLGVLLCLVRYQK